ncbi:RNA ligase family protein [Desulfobacter vibrioformis]|uniref:RNA ligase family protein n=1 Tax=Desulfobacter vibrioformis TaxID=34031 RepID=UPI000554AC79|nr:RNA ligase family protein [Desulfobacter vibrioformis]
MNQIFFKFPSTPHLIMLGGNSVRDDKVLSQENRKIFLKNILIVEEKIDGANLGISFDTQGSLILQNRGSMLSPPYLGQWKKVGNWLTPRMEILFDHLFDRYILFGEWCFAKHSIGYNRLPDYFLGFDIFDKQNNQFLSLKPRNRKFEQMNISSVPFIQQGIFTLPQLEALMGRSCFGPEQGEGIYIRYDGDKWLKQRAKIVKAKFIQNIDVHWSQKAIIPNQTISRQ